jgi:hypothetical protein
MLKVFLLPWALKYQKEQAQDYELNSKEYEPCFTGRTPKKRPIRERLVLYEGFWKTREPDHDGV